MNIALFALGSQGDVQPFLALAVGLRRAGHAVRLVSSPTFAPLAAAHGLDFAALPGDVQALMDSPELRARLERGNFLAIQALTARYAREAAPGWARGGLEAARGMDLLVAGVGGLFLALAVAERLNLPLLPASVFPFTPTRAFPAPLMPPALARLGGGFNLASHVLFRQLLWQGSRASDRIVRRVLGLPELPAGPYRSPRLAAAPTLYGFSPSVVAPPPDWTRAVVTGAWFLDPDPGWTPDPALSAFLEAGPPPVYVGFGSMGNRDPRETASLVLEALEHSGQRAILSAGWSGLEPGRVPDTVHLVREVPHTWLFPRMAAVVHHGGAGTTAAGLRAGVPNVVVPFFGDQPFWGERVRALGVGPVPLPRRKLTADGLARALRTVTTDQAMRDRAARLGAAIREERGVDDAVQAVETFGRRVAAG